MLGVDGYGCTHRADEYGCAGSAHHLCNVPFDIRGVEWVYGLQCAFKIAGAKYLIMSLWQVPDRDAMTFMSTVYRLWLKNGLPIPDAFRQTQREMRDRFYNPYSWGAFVLVE